MDISMFGRGDGSRPHTPQEILLDPTRPIVTKTDLRGVITYANESFVNISGFSREELIGAKHNIVRHPDMPASAFADLWRTIRAGQPWRGLVKNRAKNGDYYWVNAFVTPITQNGQPVGYVSVRTAPSKHQVSEAEALYRDVQEGRTPFPATRFVPPVGDISRQSWLYATGLALLVLAAQVVGGGAGWGLAGVAAIGCVLWAGILDLRILRPLNTLHQAVVLLDEGNLATSFQGQGKGLAPLFYQLEVLRIHLHATFADVHVSSEEVERRALELDKAINALAHASQEQSGRLGEITAAMEELSVSISEIAAGTDISLKAVHDTDQMARETLGSLQESNRSSSRVAVAVKQAQVKIAEVNAEIESVGGFARVIKEIADQTNLLALNASIEAARAGEQGRGFSVVADEVRNLADRTMAGTAEINTTVTGIVARTQEAVEAMDHVTKAIADSLEKIGHSTTILPHITDASGAAADAANNTTVLLKQQSSATQGITTNMEAISSVVEANHAMLALLGHASGRLRDTSRELRELIRHTEKAIAGPT